MIEYCAPSTRGVLADLARSTDPTAVAVYAAVLLDTLNPVMNIVVNKFGAESNLMMVQTLRQLADEVTQDGWNGMKAANAFDRTVDFTLYCHNPEQVAAMADWLVRHEVIKFDVADDRAGSGAWTITFEHNASQIIGALSTACRQHKVDVQLRMEAP